VEGGLLLDVVVGQSAAILELLSGEDQALLVRGNALLVLDLGLDVVCPLSASVLPLLHVLQARAMRCDAARCEVLPSSGIGGVRTDGVTALNCEQVSAGPIAIRAAEIYLRA